MLNRVVISLLSLSLILYYGKGWVIEGEDVETWKFIAYWIIDFSVAPIIVAVIAVLMKDKFMKKFTWSVFGVFALELAKTIWCRIPNNEVCENSFLTSLTVIAVIAPFLIIAFEIRRYMSQKRFRKYLDFMMLGWVGIWIADALSVIVFPVVATYGGPILAVVYGLSVFLARWKYSA